MIHTGPPTPSYLRFRSSRTASSRASRDFALRPGEPTRHLSAQAIHLGHRKIARRSTSVAVLAQQVLPDVGQMETHTMPRFLRVPLDKCLDYSSVICLITCSAFGAR